jgi:hypothetical protein
MIILKIGPFGLKARIFVRGMKLCKEGKKDWMPDWIGHDKLRVLVP